MCIERLTGDCAGAHVGNYRIVRELGRGGMGRVFEVVADDDSRGTDPG